MIKDVLCWVMRGMRDADDAKVLALGARKYSSYELRQSIS